MPQPLRIRISSYYISDVVEPEERTEEELEVMTLGVKWQHHHARERRVGALLEEVRMNTSRLTTHSLTGKAKTSSTASDKASLLPVAKLRNYAIQSNLPKEG